MKGYGLHAGPLRCWHYLPVFAGGRVDWPPLPAAAGFSFPALGSVPGIGPTLEELLGFPGPGPGPASPGRCLHWALGPSVGPGLPAQLHDQSQLLPAEQSPRLPIHVPTKAEQVRNRKKIRMHTGPKHISHCQWLPGGRHLSSSPCPALQY